MHEELPRSGRESQKIPEHAYLFTEKSNTRKKVMKNKITLREPLEETSSSIGLHIHKPALSKNLKVCEWISFICQGMGLRIWCHEWYNEYVFLGNKLMIENLQH